MEVLDDATPLRDQNKTELDFLPGEILHLVLCCAACFAHLFYYIPMGLAEPFRIAENNLCGKLAALFLDGGGGWGGGGC